MLRFLLSLSVCLCLSLSDRAFAAPPTLTLPSGVTGKAGEFLTVPSATSGKKVAWVVLDPGLSLFPVELLKDSFTAVVTSPTPGSYRLLAITAAGDEISSPVVCTVVVTPTATSKPPTASFSPTATMNAQALEALPMCGPNGCPVPSTFTIPRRFFR